jgi:hypothetical protein
MKPPKHILHELDPVTYAEDIVSVSCADILGHRDRPVALFTPALMLTHGGFDRDPVVEFNALCPAERPDLKPFVVDLKKEHERFFEGLGSVVLPGRKTATDFDRRLYAIDTERAADCFAFLGGIAFSHPKTNFFAQTCVYDIKIPDPTSKRHQTLNVTVFGVVATGFVALLQARPMRPAIALKADIASPAAKSAFLQQCGIIGLFDGVDPLQNRG